MPLNYKTARTFSQIFCTLSFNILTDSNRANNEAKQKFSPQESGHVSGFQNLLGHTHFYMFVDELTTG